MSWKKHALKESSDFSPKASKCYFKLEVCQAKASHHHGVIAKEDIPKNSVIARDGGLVFKSTFNEFPKYGYSVLIDEDLLLAPPDYEQMDTVSYFNHSCDSNVARIGGLIYSAKREILKGEELTLDYAALMAGYFDWTLECSCNSRNCRRVITSKDWKNSEIAQKLWPEWLPFIQRKILGRNCD